MAGGKPDPRALLAQIMSNSPQIQAARNVGGPPQGGNVPVQQPPIQQVVRGITKSHILETLGDVFNQLWSLSNASVTNLPRTGLHTIVGNATTTKNEQACWIIYNNNTDTMRSVNWPPRGIRDETFDNFPNLNPNEQLVGWYHTHPNTGQEGYDSGPSPEDISGANNNNLTGVVRAGTGGYQWFGVLIPQ